MHQFDTARRGQTAVPGVNSFQQASRAIDPAACSRRFDLTQFRIQFPIDARTALSELSRIGLRVFEQRKQGQGLAAVETLASLPEFAALTKIIS
jgi:hypothetical protein